MHYRALCIGLLIASSALAKTPPPTGDAGYADAGQTVFLDGELTQITVTVDPADLQTMLDDPHNDTYRHCTVRVVNSQIDETILDVGIRPRGNTSRNAVKKAWKLKFNEFVPGREFHGLEKFNLNGHHNDPSVVRGKLAWDVYNDFFVPSPRASMARMVINDGSLVDGVYANIEQIDDEFLKAWFDNRDGNLYKCRYKDARADLRFVPPGDAGAYAGLGETYTLENDAGAGQFADLADFIAFLEFADDASFADEIVSRFGVDNFLRALAVDCANGHWDNLWYGANNYYLYNNPDSGRFEYIPYDLDNVYGIDFFSTDWATRPPLSFGNGGFGWDFGSPFGGGAEPPLVRRILAIDAYRDQYLRYVRELVGAIGDPPAPAETIFADTAGDVFLAGTDPHFDILSVTLANDAFDLIATVEVAGPIDVGGGTDQNRILFFFDTEPGGSTSNPWGRAINTTVDADFFIGSWTDNGGGFAFYQWFGTEWHLLHASWDTLGGIDQDLSEKTAGLVRYTVPLAKLGLTDTDSFEIDVVTTNDRGQGFEPGLDHLSNPNQATPDYNTPSAAGPYPVHGLIPFDPGSGTFVDSPFTLGPREALIDDLRADLAPYAFAGSYADGHNDYGFTNATFLDSFTLPAGYAGGSPAPWGIKPYIEARTAHLRQTVTAPPALPLLYINEVIAINETIIADELGEFEDFVEIYNDEDTPVDVSGMYLSDDPGQPLLWQLPAGTVIPAKGFLLIWADKDLTDGPLHADFKLGSSGETVALFGTDAMGVVLIDSLTYTTIGVDESFGRFPDGSDDLETFCAVTPAAPNDPDNSCFTNPDPTPRVFINEWLASNDGVVLDEFGEDDDFIELYNDEDIAVDLGGRFLTDDLANLNKWEFAAGTTIPSKGFLLIWADNDTDQGPLHASFKLSGGGESIGLFDRMDNQLAQIDALSFGAQTTDISQGRLPDGTGCIRPIDPPTPAAPNPASPADLTGDGVVDAGDLGLFITAYLAGDLLVDYTADGVVDAGDLGAFIGFYLAGC